MVRVERGNVARKRRKKILKFAKGFKGAHSRLFRTANGQVMKALIYSYVGRKRCKQDFKKLWICRVNAAARNEGTNYSKLRNSLKKPKQDPEQIRSEIRSDIRSRGNHMRHSSSLHQNSRLFRAR